MHLPDKLLVRAISVFLLIAASGIALLFPAIINGYPLVFSDTGTYIASGFDNFIPGDRPINYGWFLRHSSLHKSTWFTVVAQAFIISSLIYYLTSRFIPRKNYTFYYFSFIILFLTGLTGLPWFTSMLLADFFTPVSYLLLFILLVKPPANIYSKALLAIAYLFSTGGHLTHAPAQLLLIVIVWISVPFIRKHFSIRINHLLKITFLVVISFLTAPSIGLIMNGKFAAGKSSHLFITARLIECGAVKKYLDNTCPQANEQFMCRYKDSLPAYGSDFLWSAGSPLYKYGGWDSCREEYRILNRTLLTSKEYLPEIIRYYFVVVNRQLRLTKFGEELQIYGKESPPGYEISWRLKGDADAFLKSKQQRGEIEVFTHFGNRVQPYLLILSALIIIMVQKTSRIRYELWLFGIFTIIAFITNALAVSIASEGARYNSRLDWIIPLAAILIVINMLTPEREKDI